MAPIAGYQNALKTTELFWPVIEHPPSKKSINNINTQSDNNFKKTD